MKFLEFLPLVMILVLSACSSDTGTSNALTPYNQVDTPETRMIAVQNHEIFSQLVQDPNCSRDEADMTVFEAQISLRDTHGVRSNVRLFLDSRSGLMKVAEESFGGLSYVNTSAYFISNDTLYIEKVGSIEIDRRGNLILNHSKADREVYLERSDRKLISRDLDENFYNFVCGNGGLSRPSRRN